MAGSFPATAVLKPSVCIFDGGFVACRAGSSVKTVHPVQVANAAPENRADAIKPRSASAPAGSVSARPERKPTARLVRSLRG